jgi:hypothetical protein
MFKIKSNVSEVSEMNDYIKEGIEKGELVTITDFIYEAIDWDYKKIGYVDFIVKTHLKDDTYSISKATVVIDCLNKKVDSVEYSRGNFKVGHNYNDNLYVIKVIEVVEH